MRPFLIVELDDKVKNLLPLIKVFHRIAAQVFVLNDAVEPFNFCVIT